MATWAIMGLNASLLGGCCFMAARIVTQVGGAALEPSTVATAPIVRETPAEAPSQKATHSAILDRNLFGAQLAGDVAVAEPEPSDEPLTETKLPLRLLGTAAATDEERSRAAIEDEKTRKHMVVSVGDAIEGHNRVRVDAIERARVILDNKGRREELALKDEAIEQPKRSRPRRTPRQARRRPERNDDKLGDRIEKLSGGDGRSLSTILSQARIVPHYVEGQMQGIKIDSIKDASLFQKAGLQNGDVITEINGIVIDSPESNKAIFDELATADAFEIAALRGDSPIQMSASADDLLEQSN
jgi:general secretion pathway protein C